jgi:hypothetical protein
MSRWNGNVYAFPASQVLAQLAHARKASGEQREKLIADLRAQGYDVEVNGDEITCTPRKDASLCATSSEEFATVAAKMFPRAPDTSSGSGAAGVPSTPNAP